MLSNVIYTNIIFPQPIFAKNMDVIEESILELESDKEQEFIVYDEKGNFLFAQEDVTIEDQFIDKDYNVYEVYLVDNEYRIAYAKKISTIKMPKIKKYNASNVSNKSINKKIGLYMTHNDESYVIGDGTDSVYGKGGIHDIANLLKKELENLGINTTLDDTLHIPHNSSAYSRSETTAQKLLNQNVDALFDIHRDGVSRSAYVTSYEGQEKCKVRIVIGKANPNKEQNLKLALYLMAVANETYPWLFADIYYAKGHYNQALSNKMLLFEMGTYLAEKDLVKESVPALADVINTTLYNTVIDEEGNILINANESSTKQSVNEILQDETAKSSALPTILIISTVLVAVFVIAYFVRIKVQ